MSTKTKLKVGSVAVALIVLALLVTVFIKTILAAALITKIIGIVSVISFGIYLYIKWGK